MAKKEKKPYSDFVPYDKASKKEKRKRDKEKRNTKKKENKFERVLDSINLIFI